MLNSIRLRIVGLYSYVTRRINDYFEGTMEFTLKNSDPEYVRLADYVIRKKIRLMTKRPVTSQEVITRSGVTIIRVAGMDSVPYGYVGHIEPWQKKNLKYLVRSFPKALEEMAVVEAEWRKVSAVSPI